MRLGWHLTHTPVTAAPLEWEMISPTFYAPERFEDPEAALARVREIYDSSVHHLRDALRQFVGGAPLQDHVRACYPFVRVRTDTVARADSRLSYGFVAGPGTFETTVTRPDLFASYLREQFRLLRRNHNVAIEVGTSAQPIPVHFSLAEHDHLEGSMPPERRLLMRDRFDLPDLAAMDDGIANGTYEPASGEPQPLALFTAPRMDYSLHRLRHYTGTAPEWFQNFVLFTNYQFYIDEFIKPWAMRRHGKTRPANTTPLLNPATWSRAAWAWSRKGHRRTWATRRRACRKCPPTT